MEWTRIVESVAGSGPLAGVLAFALWKVWVRSEERERQHDAEVQALRNQLEASQNARYDDLKSLLTPHS